MNTPSYDKYDAPPLSEWKPRKIDHLLHDISNAPDIDPSDASECRSEFAAAQDRDRSAAGIIAAFSLLLVAGIVTALGVASHWAVLSYWLAR